MKIFVFSLNSNFHLSIVVCLFLVAPSIDSRKNMKASSRISSQSRLASTSTSCLNFFLMYSKLLFLPFFYISSLEINYSLLFEVYFFPSNFEFCEQSLSRFHEKSKTIRGLQTKKEITTKFLINFVQFPPSFKFTSLRVLVLRFVSNNNKEKKRLKSRQVSNRNYSKSR